MRVLEHTADSNDRAVDTIELDASRRLGRGGGGSPGPPLQCHVI